jgi:hypothetical protein
MRRSALTFLFVHLALASNLAAQGSAGQAGEFLRFGVGAKALGLGRAFTSIADDASAPYWNPSGLSSLARNGGSFMFMHMPLREGASFNYLAAGLPLRLFFVASETSHPIINVVQEFNFGVGVLWHSLGEFEFYNNDGSVATGSENSVRQTAVYLSFSYPLHTLLKPLSARTGWLGFLKGDLDFGLTTKLVRQNLFGEHGAATSFDLGWRYRHQSGIFQLGFTLRDLNQPAISYNDHLAEDDIPSHGVLGFSMRPPFGPLRGLWLSFDYAVIQPAGRERDYRFGVEYDLSFVRSDLPLKLRLGANSNYESLTIGINFSPEIIWGQDWLPYADWAYANDRSGFDATGPRYSISIDRNPFTAQYWYQKAMIEYRAAANLFELNANDKLRRYLKNAEAAKNSGSRAYRYEAALRGADLEFLASVAEMENGIAANGVTGNPSHKNFNRVVALYTNHCAKFLLEDYGKSEVDRQEYFKSFIYYVQSLILSGHDEEAVKVCADSGRSWGKSVNVLPGGGSQNSEYAGYYGYLHAYVLYKSGFQTEAVDLLNRAGSGHYLTSYFLTHIAFLRGEYQKALRMLDEIDLNAARFPQHLFLPVTQDHVFGDEVLFLKGAVLYKLNPRAANDYISEFAKIPRFFPDSDLARFLTTEDEILTRMIEFYKNNNLQALEALLTRVIFSYLNAFSNGLLKEESYTYNYK